MNWFFYFKMQNNMKKFTEIEQFRNVIREVRSHCDYMGKDENGDAKYSHSTPYPVFTFRGTVKLHGTNSAIVLYKQSDFVDGEQYHFEFQSRENVLSLEQDNAGFMRTMLTKDYRKLFKGIEFNESCAIYGEWCGCFPYGTPILLSDDTSMPIGKIVNGKLDVEILSYNFETGKLEPKKIKNWFKNGETDNWLKLNIQRRKRGGRSTGFIVTPNHKIFIKENNLIIEKFANEIKINDKVLISGKVLTFNVKQFLMGSLLGDASFAEKRSIQISHSDDNQKFYNDFIVENLKNIFSIPQNIISGYGSNMRIHHSNAFPEIEDLYDELHLNNSKSKQVTVDYLNKLSPLALATWYMDDGSIVLHNGKSRQYRCSLHCQGFGTENVKLIEKWFNSRGYYCNTINENIERGTEIRFTVEGAASFLYTIAPYILKEFNYKLPKILQSVEKITWWSHYLNDYDNSLVEANVESIENYTPLKREHRVRYDIEIEDNHNYFANNTLVHNSGIQKSVAITQLPKMFVIFAVKIDDVYQDMKNFTHLKIEEEQIYNIMQFSKFSIDIDFNSPELIQNKLIELTNEVEKECPVAKYFGIEGVGEGIVWEYINGEERYIFKVKGEKHQNSKVKTLTTVNVEEVENLKAFIEYAVTENRLLQGIDKMKELGLPIEPKTTGEYLRWVYNDVVKEESDTMVTNGIDSKKIGSAVSAKARMFWLNYMNSNFS
jgi:hypothetical protein